MSNLIQKLEQFAERIQNREFIFAKVKQVCKKTKVMKGQIIITSDLKTLVLQPSQLDDVTILEIGIAKKRNVIDRKRTGRQKIYGEEIEEDISTMVYKPYTTYEEVMIICSGMRDKKLSVLLGRSVKSIEQKRRILKLDPLRIHEIQEIARTQPDLINYQEEMMKPGDFVMTKHKVKAYIMGYDVDDELYDVLINYSKDQNGNVVGSHKRYKGSYLVQDTAKLQAA